MTLPFTGFVVPSGGSSSGGSGDVTGPGSSTDNAIARFDGAGGKTLQDSGILVTDAAQLSWEGATADDFETTLGVTDPTADQAILLPNESGTILVGALGATDDAIVISDGTGGQKAAGSAATLTSAGSLTIPSAETIKFSTDLGLSRAAAGILKVTNGSTGDGSVRLSVGTKALPSVAFDDDVDTGIYQRATGFLMFTANGAEVGFVGGGATHGWVAPNGIGFSSNTESAAVDVGLTRHVTGILRVTGNGNNVAPLLHTIAVEANTAGSGTPNALTANESLALMTNEGTTAANYHTLPTAVAGYVFEFVVQDADGMRIVANTSDTIRVIDKVTAAAGYIESTTIGSTVRLVSINAVEWFATSIHGVWTDGTFTFDDTGSTSP